MFFGKAERLLRGLYCSYGHLVAKCPIPFVVIPILLSAALAVGINYQKGLEGGAEGIFTSTNAPYKREEAILRSLWSQNSNKFYPGKDSIRRRAVYIIVASSDKGDILRNAQSNAVLEFLDLISRNVSGRTHDGLEVTYQNVCAQWRGHCFENKHVSMICSILISGKKSEVSTLTYPDFQLPYAHTIHLPTTLGGVEFDKRTGHILNAKAWLLVYELKSGPANVSKNSETWENALEKFIYDRTAYSPLISGYIFHSRTFEQQLAENSNEITPKFYAAFLLLVTFSLASSFRATRLDYGDLSIPIIDWVESKPFLAFGAVITAGMGVASSLGLLAFCGVPYSDIVSVMPFLAVSIGVDNMFLFLNCWRQTPRLSPVSDRLSEMLSHAAVSVTITSLTDALSFGIGTITPIPGVRLFCSYTGVAIVLTFFYQISCLIGIVALLGRLEESGRHCLFFIKLKEFKPSEDTCFLSMILLRRPPFKPEVTNHQRSSFHVKLVQKYTNFVLTWQFKVAVFLLFIVYIAIAVWGIYGIPIGLQKELLLVDGSPATAFFKRQVLDGKYLLFKVAVFLLFISYMAIAIWGIYGIPIGLQKELLDGSPATSFFKRQDEYFPTVTNQVQIIIQNVPDLSRLEEREKIEKMVEVFEQNEFSLGRNNTNFWLFEYRKHLQDLGFEIPNGPSFYAHLNQFLLNSDFYDYDIIWETKNGTKQDRIKAFLFSTRFKRLNSNLEKIAVSRWFRTAALRYPQYELSTFSEIWIFSDQYDMIRPTTATNLGLALVCMLVVSLLLLPQVYCAIWVGCTLISIEIGLIGFMSVWGVNLDCISMITVLMSVGFSVDFAAHITYGYMTATEKETELEKLQEAFLLVGLPCIQGALSTIFGVAVLALVPAYMAQTFMKTIVLIMLFGLLHALVFLPVILTCSVYCKKCTKQKVYSVN